MMDHKQFQSLQMKFDKSLKHDIFVLMNNRSISYKLLAFYYWCEATGPHWTSMNGKAFEHLPFYLYSADEQNLYLFIIN